MVHETLKLCEPAIRRLIFLIVLDQDPDMVATPKKPSPTDQSTTFEIFARATKVIYDNVLQFSGEDGFGVGGGHGGLGLGIQLEPGMCLMKSDLLSAAMYDEQQHLRRTVKMNATTYASLMKIVITHEAYN
jgi:hypothetical protein